MMAARRRISTFAGRALDDAAFRAHDDRRLARLALIAIRGGSRLMALQWRAHGRARVRLTGAIAFVGCAGQRLNGGDCVLVDVIRQIAFKQDCVIVERDYAAFELQAVDEKNRHLPPVLREFRQKTVLRGTLRLAALPATGGFFSTFLHSYLLWICYVLPIGDSPRLARAAFRSSSILRPFFA